ncbi:DUF2461 family protein [Ilumatobacter sp.]|uniref:DUF2461 family protein n=1 Tax=Ilumatobacter sp. TaxID=1967498 RepID=UPI003AF9D7C6
MSFDGFDPAALALLDDLPAMTADDYARHKASLAAGVTKPGLALITDVADALGADLTVVPRSSVSPLHRDLRFAPEGAARYKDHLLLTTWEGADKKTSPMFWIRVDAHRAGFASGIGFTPAVRERWRAAVGAAAGEELAAMLDGLVADRDADVAGDRVKKVPAPFDPDHPRADLLRHTGFQVRFVDDLPASVSSTEFVDWCAERLSALMPVHQWLLAQLID